MVIELVTSPSVAETRIFSANLVNTMTADALAPCIARTSTAMILILQDKRVVVFQEGGLHLPAHPIVEE